MDKVLTNRDPGDEITPLSRQARKVIQWRFDWLRAVGYSLGDAGRIAERTDIDLHFAVELAGRCEDEELRMRILL